jgi:hypothetical protein
MPMPDISGIPAYHRIDDREGFSLDEGFSFDKRKILRDHVLPLLPGPRGNSGRRRGHRAAQAARPRPHLPPRHQTRPSQHPCRAKRTIARHNALDATDPDKGPG